MYNFICYYNKSYRKINLFHITFGASWNRRVLANVVLQKRLHLGYCYRRLVEAEVPVDPNIAEVKREASDEPWLAASACFEDPP